MMKKLFFFSIIALSFLLAFTVRSGEAGNDQAPDAHLGNMMLEHVGMDCTNCHGKDGPAGAGMKNHPSQKCTDCHTLKKGGKTAKFKTKKISIARENMHNHKATFTCKGCHGEEGAPGMMMEHEGMDCETCHVVEDRHVKK